MRQTDKVVMLHLEVVNSEMYYSIRQTFLLFEKLPKNKIWNFEYIMKSALCYTHCLPHKKIKRFSVNCNVPVQFMVY